MPFNRLNHSILGEIRPRFKLKIESKPDEALDFVETTLLDDKTVFGGRNDHMLNIKIPQWERHYWSPEMSVRIEVEEYTDFTTVSCLIGPKQSVWAMFTFIYAALVLLTTFGGIYGLVKYQEMGFTNWLWVIPIGTITILSIFVTSKMGQRKGRDQMLHLVSFIYHTLEKYTKVERLDN